MKFTKLIPLVLCSALIFTSCDDDDDNVINVPTTVETNFNQQFPNASAVQWEKDFSHATSYLKAEFKVNGTEVEAWYTYDGTWVKTETDYNDPLPLAITNLLSTNYPGFRIDDVDLIETPQMKFFEIDLEKGKNEIELSVKADGTIININDNQHKIPTVVAHHFQERFPGANVKEWEKEGTLLKAEFFYNNVETEAWFTYSGTWVKTETDYHSALPEAVNNYIQSNYNGYKIDDINWVETPQQNYFEIELEKGKEDIILSIKIDGTVISAVPDKN